MNKKILVIDDEPMIVELVKNRLEHEDYSVSTASDGLIGLEILRTQKPDLIVLDILMPNMDGYNFIQEVNKDPGINHIPILVLTANAHLKELFAMEGVDNYMVKPFDKEEFLDKIRELTN